MSFLELLILLIELVDNLSFLVELLLFLLFGLSYQILKFTLELLHSFELLLMTLLQLNDLSLQELLRGNFTMRLQRFIIVSAS